MTQVFAVKAQGVQIHQKETLYDLKFSRESFESCNKKREVAKYCSHGTIVKKLNCVGCEKEFMGSYLSEILFKLLTVL